MKPYTMMNDDELQMELDVLQNRMMQENDPIELERLDEKITEIEDFIEQSANLDNY